MSYYTHHMHIDAGQYVYVDMPLHHAGDPQHILGDVHSENSVRKKNSIFIKITNIKCHENPSVGNLVTPCGKINKSISPFERRWEDSIKMDLQEVGGGRGDWMVLAQDRDRWRALVGTVRDFRVP